ncbi:MAG TPA: glycosyltransferase [Steroidobacteraceae bacterium]
MTSVSVAMATYNGRKYIRGQLDSLAAQSQRPSELVITDDCSADDTIAVIEAFAKSAPFPVKLSRNETRLGYRANFMRAASLCGSELIAFCDQDDFWYPGKIASAVRPFADPEVLLTYHNADVVTDDGDRISSLTRRLVPIVSGPWFYPLGFTEVFCRSLLSLSDLWPMSRDPVDGSQVSAHDVWFFFLAGVLGKVVYLDEPLVAYVQHGQNAFGFTNLTFRQRTKMFFRNRAAELANFAEVANNRAAILDAAKDTLDGVWRKRAAASADYYKSLNIIVAERSRLYTSRSPVDRARSFRTILGKSGYASAWGLGHRALIVDACIGIPVGPYLS